MDKILLGLIFHDNILHGNDFDFLSVRAVCITAPKNLVIAVCNVCISDPVKFSVIVGQRSALTGVSGAICRVMSAVGFRTKRSGSASDGIVVLKVTARHTASAVSRTNYLKTDSGLAAAILGIHPWHRYFLRASYVG